ncbi:uncharacterized protein LOC114076391 [Solanum pennellii]|uniref:Uncharacterized protein LOC114076391 n=1 Tax=Solanum pennellii TaxID=28526 RepID=A0ABM1V5W2_SOLPN|nr:uncharacterized protein LOC114076391 [Solanum pennellii]
MVFESAEQFRKAVADYSCEYKTRLKLKPNDKKRVRVKCEDKKCKWLLFASIDKDSGDFVVKNYYLVHVCPQSAKNKLCTSKFVAEKFKDEIYLSTIYKIMGNSGIDRESQPGKTLFVYFYVCFDTLKRGWLEGCRKIIGFDGCFLKGSCKGELLVAVGRNGNQQMFPITWAAVDTETKHSWSFFLKYLIKDLNLGTGHGLTVMSDMQKGLVPTLCALLPDSEKRRYIRHIWSNWHQLWSGEERRKQFWRSAKSSFEVKFEDEMDKLNKLGNKICEDLLHYEKTTWCKAYFKEHSKCDIVENNICETFNSWILVARHKAIITMLEEIRHKIMNRNIAMRQFAETWISNISPMARLVLEENIDLARFCEVRFNGDIGYEILDGQYKHIVYIRKKTCTCRT